MGPRQPSFGHFAVSILNLVLRHMLSSWHPRLRNWERCNPSQDENNWPLSCEFWTFLDKSPPHLFGGSGLRCLPRMLRMSKVSDCCEVSYSDHTSTSRLEGSHFGGSAVSPTVNPLTVEVYARTSKSVS